MSKVKDLGIYHDSKLTFTTHIHNLALQLRSLYKIFVRNLSNIRYPTAYKSIFSEYFQSKIDYCIPVWGMASPSTLLPLQAIHKKFLKQRLRIPWNNHDYSYEEITRLASTTTIYHIYIIRSAGVLHSHL